jgi:hypothetical protein
MAMFGGDSVSGGTYRQCVRDIYLAIHQTPFLLQNLLRHIDEINDPAAVAWYLVFVSKESAEARQDESVDKLATVLKSRTETGASHLATLLCAHRSARLYSAAALGTTLPPQNERAETIDETPDEIPSLDAARAMPALPGTRHDNDHVDFRSISVTPTAEEINCRQKPFLPLPSGSTSLQSAPDSAEAMMLDRLFRLLREDMLGPMQKELHEQLKAKKEDCRQLYSAPRITGVALKPKPCVLVSVEMPRTLYHRVKKLKSTSEKQEFWNSTGRRILGKDTIVLFTSETGAVVRIGIVVRRDPKEMSGTLDAGGKGGGKGEGKSGGKGKGKGKSGGKGKGAGKGGGKRKGGGKSGGKGGKGPSSEGTGAGKGKGRDRILTETASKYSDRRLTVGISFLGETLSEVLPLFKQSHDRNGHRSLLGCQVFNASASFFAYEPVLRSLQLITDIPFREELVPSASPLLSPKYPDLPHGTLLFENLPSKLKDQVASDPSQAQAVKLALRSRVALIQGPPGTGKTHVGVVIAQAIREAALAKQTPVRILCMCFTNHALDNFLEALLDAGVPQSKLIRMGGSDKISERLQKLSIRKMQDVKFERHEGQRYGQLKEAMSKAEESITEKLEMAKKSTWGPSWWRTVSKFLAEACYKVELEQLMPPSDHNTDGFVTVALNNQKVENDYLWKRWLAGDDAGIYAATNPKKTKKTKKTNVSKKQTEEAAGKSYSGGLWDLDLSMRRDLKSKWEAEWIEPEFFELQSAMADYEDACTGIEDLRACSDVSKLELASVIGCTTTSAAKQRTVLRRSAPDVIIVEEAGEIFEAQIIAALTPSCKQLIMIGDHKQLRPKAEHFPLRQEAGCGYDIDISLFERLATNENFAATRMATLNEQHRMRPEISRLVRRMTYPELRDHEKVLAHPLVRGLTSNVVFINHTNSESSDEEKAVLGSHSRINTYEASMVVSTVQFLVQQGYKCDQICILTPYLGQLMHIKKVLANSKFRVEIGSLDQGDLARFNVQQENTAGGEINLGVIRVATIDNFQGEEADVIVASLVRSNADASIGFLSSHERVNVLLSRAKHGMILIGDAETLTKAKNAKGRRMWDGVLQQLRQHKQVFDGLPTVCEIHDTKSILSSPQMFCELCPDGGCSKLCEAPLACGHHCPKKCHPNADRIHEMIVCTERMSEPCPRNPQHTVTRICSSPEAMACPIKIKEQCAMGHPVFRVCSKDTPAVCEVMLPDMCPVGHYRERKCYQSRLGDECDDCDELFRQQQEEEKRKRFLQKQQAKQQVEEQKRLVAAQAGKDTEKIKLDGFQKKTRTEIEVELLNREKAILAKQRTKSMDMARGCLGNQPPAAKTYEIEVEMRKGGHKDASAAAPNRFVADMQTFVLRNKKQMNAHGFTAAKLSAKFQLESEFQLESGGRRPDWWLGYGFDTANDGFMSIPQLLECRKGTGGKRYFPVKNLQLLKTAPCDDDNSQIAAGGGVPSSSPRKSLKHLSDFIVGILTQKGGTIDVSVLPLLYKATFGVMLDVKECKEYGYPKLGRLVEAAAGHGQFVCERKPHLVLHLSTPHTVAQKADETTIQAARLGTPPDMKNPRCQECTRPLDASSEVQMQDLLCQVCISPLGSEQGDKGTVFNAKMEVFLGAINIPSHGWTATKLGTVKNHALLDHIVVFTVYLVSQLRQRVCAVH